MPAAERWHHDVRGLESATRLGWCLTSECGLIAVRPAGVSTAKSGWSFFVTDFICCASFTPTSVLRFIWTVFPLNLRMPDFVSRQKQKFLITSSFTGLQQHRGPKPNEMFLCQWLVARILQKFQRSNVWSRKWIFALGQACPNYGPGSNHGPWAAFIVPWLIVARQHGQAGWINHATSGFIFLYLRYAEAIVWLVF